MGIYYVIGFLINQISTSSLVRDSSSCRPRQTLNQKPSHSVKNIRLRKLWAESPVEPGFKTKVMENKICDKRHAYAHFFMERVTGTLVAS